MLDRTTFARATSARPDAALDAASRAMDAFEKLSNPDPREEDWRYVDVTTDFDALTLAEPGAPLGADPMIEALGDIAGGATIIDGVTTQFGADTASSARVLRIAESYADPAVAALLDDGVPLDLDRFAAAAHAFSSDGIVIHAPARSHSPVPYVVDVQATATSAISFPRIGVVADDGAEVEVVIRYRSPDGVAATVVPLVETIGGANARVRLTAIQTLGDGTRSVVLQRMLTGRDGGVLFAEAGLGGHNARTHLTVDLAGRGSNAQVLGVYFGDHDRTLDYRYFMNHRAPNTTSEMTLKGAVGDSSKSVFTGMIRVEPEAQKTNAHQNNKNLVLSEGAEAHSVPNLEILANDVRCGHGSAVGPLDEEQRYYLMSRGLDRFSADRLQVIGFFEDVLGRFVRQEFDPMLRTMVTDTYEGIIARGPA